jgi:hypothetical protein
MAAWSVIIRALKTALEDHVGQPLHMQRPLLTWLVRHASWTLARYNPYLRGSTPYTRLKGAPYLGRVCEFGEKVLVLIPGDSHGHVVRRGKFENRWEPGTWFGKAEESDEHLVAVNGSVGKYRTLRRLTDGQWDAAGVLGLTVTPSRPRLDPAPELPPAGAEPAANSFPLGASARP